MEQLLSGGMKLLVDSQILFYSEYEQQFKELNPQQRRAVEVVEGPLLVAAGAGTGKTRVLAYRIANLIQNHGMSPASILAITFTNKAADEMKHRVTELIGASVENMWVKTFHSACAHILREQSEQLGLPRQIVINEMQQYRIVQELGSQAGLDLQRFPPDKLASLISNAKNHMIETTDQFAQWLNHQIGSEGMHTTFLSQIVDFHSKYLRHLGDRLQDFDDLLLATEKMLDEYPSVRAQYQNRFGHILVDEYQDTNRAQFLIARHLAEQHRNIMVVGDRDQSIYAFRGAEIANFASFIQDFPESQVVSLEQNYRSSQTILRAGNTVITENPDFYEDALDELDQIPADTDPEEMVETFQRLAEETGFGRSLVTDKEVGERLVVYAAEDEYDEAGFIADQVEALRTEGYSWADMVVLYRNHYRGRECHRVLNERGIRTQVISRIGTADRPSIGLLLTYLQSATHPEVADWLGTQVLEGCRIVSEMIPIINQALEERGVVAAIEVAVGQSGLEERLSGSNDQESTNVIEEMKRRAALFRLPADPLASSVSQASSGLGAPDTQARKPSDSLELLAGFLQDWNLANDVDYYDPDQDAVTMMTVHSVKGMEFPVVFLIGMEEGSFPDSKSSSDVDIEEERRLAYVAINRAMDRMFISHAQKFGTKDKDPSRFLQELPSDSFEQLKERDRQQADAKPTPLELGEISVGMRVTHPHRGVGVIEEIDHLPDLEDTAQITVRFPSGQQKLSLPWADLYPTH